MEINGYGQQTDIVEQKGNHHTHCEWVKTRTQWKMDRFHYGWEKKPFCTLEGEKYLHACVKKNKKTKKHWSQESVALRSSHIESVFFSLKLMYVKGKFQSMLCHYACTLTLKLSSVITFSELVWFSAFFASTQVVSRAIWPLRDAVG